MGLKTINMKKYFKPDLEDIRVGYEYELIDYGLHIPETQKVKDLKDMWTLSFIIDNVQVPYLTKEQIEGKGWTFIANIGNSGFYFKKGKFELEYRPDGWGDGTSKYDLSVGEDLYYPKYNGECKDINAFRYLCKILNIN